MPHDRTEPKSSIVIGLVVGFLVDIGGTCVLFAAGVDPWVSVFAPMIPAILAARLFGADW